SGPVHPSTGGGWAAPSNGQPLVRGSVPTKTPRVSAAKKPAKSDSSPCAVLITPPSTVDRVGRAFIVFGPGVPVGVVGAKLGLIAPGRTQSSMVGSRLGS